MSKMSITRVFTNLQLLAKFIKIRDLQLSTLGADFVNMKVIIYARIQIVRQFNQELRREPKSTNGLINTINLKKTNTNSS